VSSGRVSFGQTGRGEQMWKSTMLAALLVAFTAAGCSSDEPTGDGGSQVPPPSAQVCDSPVETAKITIADLAFQPNCFELPAGTDTLTVENTDGTDHTFTMDGGFRGWKDAGLTIEKS